MVCGIATDPQYGPMVMFGLGGVFVEAIGDVMFRVAPLTDQDAKDMVCGVKAYKLLQGARGTKPADIGEIENDLLRLSQLVSDFPFVDELDINPLIISEKSGEAVAVDGRIKVRIEEAKKALGLA
jgi:acetyltransferase